MLQLPSPVHPVSYRTFREYDVTVQVKREDEIHPLISGNKWRKLKYHIQHFRAHQYSHLITFGGAYSNHVFAFAHACKIYCVPGVVIIRGEEDMNNPTMQAVRNNGVDIHYVTRSDYRSKEHAPFIRSIIDEYPSPFLVPEGGSSLMARAGIHEMAEEIKMLNKIPDFIVLAAGTGCTSGCLIEAMYPLKIKIDVYSALKGKFMQKAIEEWSTGKGDWNVIEDMEFGGYGKVNHTLIDFINSFYEETGIPIDPIYNGKVLYGLTQRIKSGTYPPGSNILWIHTGGLQGIDGFNQRWKGKYLINK
ncbi:MAG: pyridoxal-phosphate dependent enzyme [Saprospiraceae bacterium]|nr:pyridoxal-phosphate dependent enzyme [Saprospiraceae bacterium]